MLMTKRKLATIGEILVEEFIKPIGLTQGALALIQLSAGYSGRNYDRS
jgi:plasmid maintenance system antidote protein VapI